MSRVQNIHSSLVHASHQSCRAMSNHHVGHVKGLHLASNCILLVAAKLLRSLEILDTSGTLRVGIGFLSVAEPHFRGPHLHDVIICGTHGPMAGCEVPLPFQCANAPTKKRNLKPSIVHWACSASEIQVFVSQPLFAA